MAVHTIANATAIATDRDDGTYCALLSTGHVDCWGSSGKGELGNGSTTSSDVPVAAMGISTATAVAAAPTPPAASRAAVERPRGLLGVQRIRRARQRHHGDLHLAGGGQEPQYGYRGQRRTGRLLRPAVDQSSGLLGYGGNGDLGNGTFNNDSDVPVSVRKITNATQAVGGDFGSARCCHQPRGLLGSNGSGELGNGTFTESDVPVAVLAAS